METNQLSSPNFLHKRQGEDTKRLRQLEATIQAFYKQPCTMLMAARQTEIERANICRYIATLRKQNKVAIIKKGVCKITQHLAGYYTSNPALFPPTPLQLNLF